MKDIRWEQRFSNFQKALRQLEKGVQLARERDLTLLEKQGLIQGFEYTHQLAWKTMKDFIGSKGNMVLYGSKDTTRESFQLGLIEDGDGWMDMINSRNETSHTYNQLLAEKIADHITRDYIYLFTSFEQKMLDQIK